MKKLLLAIVLLRSVTFASEYQVQVQNNIETNIWVRANDGNARFRVQPGQSLRWTFTSPTIGIYEDGLNPDLYTVNLDLNTNEGVLSLISAARVGTNMTAGMFVQRDETSTSAGWHPIAVWSVGFFSAIMLGFMTLGVRLISFAGRGRTSAEL